MADALDAWLRGLIEELRHVPPGQLWQTYLPRTLADTLNDLREAP
jgi:hypothetical protein